MAGFGATRRARLGWGLLAALTLYAGSISIYAFLSPGWKPHRVETAWILFSAAAVVALLARLNTTSRGSAAEDGWTARPWPLVLIVLATLWVYREAPGVGYLSDDFVLLTAQPGAGWQHGAVTLFRPLPLMLIQAIDRAAPAGGASWLHAASVAIHCVSGVLLYLIAGHILASRGAATAAAAIFLLHPATVEAVVWIAGIQDVLVVACTLAFVLGALRDWHPLVLFLLLVSGLLSKETAVAMPVLAAAASWAGPSPPPARVRWTIAGAAAAALAFAAWRLSIGGPELQAAPSRYLLKEMLSGAFGGLAVPWTTDELRSLRLAGPIVVAWIALAVWASLARQAGPHVVRAVLLGLVWVVVSIAPVNRMFFVSDWLEGGRYLYLPSAGWALALAAGTAVPGVRRLPAIATGVVVVLWTFATAAHVADWRRAGTMRDRIMQSALAVHASGQCARNVFAGATDNVRGRFVFRNGFEQALERAGVPVVAEPHEGACVHAWTGERFERVR